MLLDMRFTWPRHVAALRPRCVPRLKPSASAMHRCSCCVHDRRVRQEGMSRKGGDGCTVQYSSVQ